MPNLTQQQIDGLLATRQITDETTRKRRKAAIFAEVKSELKIPKSTKLRVEIDNAYASDYAALKYATNGTLIPPLQDYRGPRVVNRIAPSAPAPAQFAPAAAPSFPFPTRMEAGTPCAAPPRAAVKPPPQGVVMADNVERAYMPARPMPTTAMLKLGSISLEDATALLRLEGDTRESFATTSEQVSDAVFVRGDRLYFVL